jgi:hypothetical protein
MSAEIYGLHANETHEQFVQRASRIFPPKEASRWSRIERAVFNHLMAQLIYRHGYSAISNEMLQQSREDMIEIVNRSTDANAKGHSFARHHGVCCSAAIDNPYGQRTGTANSRNAHSQMEQILGRARQAVLAMT